MRHVTTLLGSLAVIGLSVSCGDVVRQGRAPAYLVIDTLQGISGGSTAGTATSFLQSDVLGSVTSPAPCTQTTPCPTVFNDSGSVGLRLSLKDVGTTASPTVATPNNEITLNRYHVTYRRADGHNTQGVDVPYAFDGAVTATVPSAGVVTVGFELVRHVAKKEAPLVQLINASSVITTVADVTFYGRDQVGNDVSVTGSIQIDFGNFGDR